MITQLTLDNDFLHFPPNQVFTEVRRSEVHLTCIIPSVVLLQMKEGEGFISHKSNPGITALIVPAVGDVGFQSLCSNDRTVKRVVLTCF